MNSLRYIQYSRKSSESKEKQALSIPDQNTECEKLVMREGLNVVKKLKEEKTAFKPHKRKYFDLMLELIKSGQADAILCWHVNRISRNAEESGIIVQLLQDGIIKEIRTASGDAYTPESDHFILQIKMGMANEYSRGISKDVKRAMKSKCERGEYPREAPIGFEGYGEKGRRNIKPHPFEAEVIKNVCALA